MTPRIGELFAGYGGLGMGVQAVFGGEVAWYSEIDKGALKILEHRFPGVPNVGDVTTADWSQVEPVDILTGGSPCQDLSHAGKRAGMTEGTRSNLWVAMREAIAQLRPPIVVWENVRGAYSAAADSEVEPCAGCVGDGPGVHLRALGRVLGDLSELGYDASWHGIRAADVGAPHGRFRVFVIATDAAGNQRRVTHRDGTTAADTRSGAGWEHGRDSSSSEARPDGRDQSGRAGTLLPTPSCSDSNGAGAHGDGGLDLRTAVSLMPTPRATDGTKGGPNQRGSSGDLMLPSAVHLLPTPGAAVGEKGRSYGQNPAPRRAAGKQVELADIACWELADRGALLPTPQWGDYAAAIARWERVLGREAPAPTMRSARGNPQLSHAFVEWMMGLPAGWVTDVPGITRNEALKALGNGVVPQQCAAALRTMLAWEAVA